MRVCFLRERVSSFKVGFKVGTGQVLPTGGVYVCDQYARVVGCLAGDAGGRLRVGR